MITCSLSYLNAERDPYLEALFRNHSLRSCAWHLWSQSRLPLSPDYGSGPEHADDEIVYTDEDDDEDPEGGSYRLSVMEENDGR
ncbi:hypothetical protein Tco_1385005 [Tanacetum coccineum]